MLFNKHSLPLLPKSLRILNFMIHWCILYCKPKKKPFICLFDSYSFIHFIRADYNSRQLNSYFYGWWNWQAEFHSLGTNALEKGTNPSSFSYELKWQHSLWSPDLVANQFMEGKILNSNWSYEIWEGHSLLQSLVWPFTFNWSSTTYPGSDLEAGF